MKGKSGELLVQHREASFISESIPKTLKCRHTVFIASLTVGVKEPESQGLPMRESKPLLFGEAVFKLDVGEGGRNESAVFLKSKSAEFIAIIIPQGAVC